MPFTQTNPSGWYNHYECSKGTRDQNISAAVRMGIPPAFQHLFCSYRESGHKITWINSNDAKRIFGSFSVTEWCEICDMPPKPHQLREALDNCHACGKMFLQSITQPANGVPMCKDCWKPPKINRKFTFK